MFATLKHVPGSFKHTNCRNGIYPKTEDVNRFLVPDDYVFWSVPYPQYNDVPIYSLPGIGARSWADPEKIGNYFKPKFNAIDGNINRTSYNGIYQINEDGYPLNPFGRTGLRGRGILGRWGPNHSASTIVTRWKRCEDFEYIRSPTTNRKILEVVILKRCVSGIWELPGTMLDKRRSLGFSLQRKRIGRNNNAELRIIYEIFEEHVHAYKGYVDDPRNTDNAWIETMAVSYHDNDGITNIMEFNCEDDIFEVKWIDVDSKLDLYANQLQMVEQIVKIHKAHW